MKRQFVKCTVEFFHLKNPWASFQNGSHSLTLYTDIFVYKNCLPTFSNNNHSWLKLSSHFRWFLFSKHITCNEYIPVLYFYNINIKIWYYSIDFSHKYVQLHGSEWDWFQILNTFSIPNSITVYLSFRHFLLAWVLHICLPGEQREGRDCASQ